MALDAPSAKYKKLVELLRQIGVAKGSPARAVVFSERVATLRWLQEWLAKFLRRTDGPVLLTLALAGFLVDRTRRLGERETTARIMLLAG